MYRFPDHERALSNPFPWRGILCSLAVFFALAIMLATGARALLEPIDRALAGLIRHSPSALIDTLAVSITFFGDFPLTLGLMLGLIVLLILFGRRALALHAAWLFFAIKLSVATSKLLVGRERPVALYSGGDIYAFPSGHTASSTVLLGVVAALLLAQSRTDLKASAGSGLTPGPDGSHVAQRRRDIAALLAFSLCALAVAWSRIRLGAHWPTDVIASMALALAASLSFAWHCRREPAFPRACFIQLIN